MMPENNITSKYVRNLGIAWLVLGVIVFGLLVRFFHREDYTSSDAFNYYHALIENVRTGSGVIQHPMIPPLLPWAQGLFMRLAGIHDPVCGAQWFNLGLLLPLNLFILWSLLRRLAQSAACRWAALLFGISFVLLNPLVIWRSLATGNEMLYGFCLGALLLFFLHYIDRRDKGSLIMLALLAALCTLARAEGVIWPVVISLCLLYFHRLSARMFRRQALMWLVVLLVWLPRLTYMQTTTGYPILDIRIVNVLHFMGWDAPNHLLSKKIKKQAQVLFQIQHSTLTTTLERRVARTPTLHQNLTWRATYSLRGVIITFGPLGILYLAWCWPTVRRKVAARWKQQHLFWLHGFLVLQVLIIAATVWFEERYGSSMIVILSLTGGILLAETTADLPNRRKVIIHFLLACVMTAWAVFVMWKLPTRRLEKMVADALRDQVPPGSVVMSMTPAIPYYLHSKWCPVPDWPHRRIKISSAQLVTICREADVDIIVWGEFPMWLHPWWQQDAAARAIIRDFSLPLNLPAGADGQPIIVIDVRRMSGR